VNRARERAARSAASARVSPLSVRQSRSGPRRRRGPAHRGLSPLGRAGAPRMTERNDVMISRRRAGLLMALAPVMAAMRAAEPQKTGAAPALSLPLKEGSLRFAVMGDTGRGDRAQNEVAAQMAALQKAFPFELVIMLGDNIYGADTPAD